MPSFSATYREDALLLHLTARRHPAVVAFTILWLCGWSLTIVVAALELVRHPALDFERTALWLGFWIVVGLRLAFPLLWTAGGKNELIRVDSATLAIERRVGPFKHVRRLDASSIRHLRVEPYVRSRVPDWQAVRRFWSGGVGRVGLECGRRTYGFGTGLSETEAAETIALIRARIPHLQKDTPADAVTGRARRAFGLASIGGSAYLTTVLLIPALTLPLGLALTDRPICFCDDTIPPDAPVDVSAMQPARRVYLVPLDGFAADTAHQVANNFRARFNVSLEVVPSTTEAHAYNPDRRQLNASAVLASLQTQYPSERAVVIAVTDKDMYIPGLSWRYAFSYRREGRLAVVSTARMDHGCLGLFTAGKDRRLARLRKMVGKNLGVLYYGLPLSGDPRSLLYANIGGPQELDVMSEIF